MKFDSKVTIKAHNKNVWLKIKLMIIPAKFKWSSWWLKSAVKILAVFYDEFLRYLSSKSSLASFYGNSLSI